MPTRRDVIMSSGIGIAGLAGCIGGDGKIPPLGLSNDGKRKFNFRFGGGGYKYAEWLENGNLEIYIKDDPPMEEWVFVGPGRNIIARGIPSSFGGPEEIELNHPIPAGEYLLSGFEAVADEDSLTGVSAERTGTVELDFEPGIAVVDVDQADAEYEAEFKIKNVGSMPFHISGVQFSEDIPGRGHRRHEYFDGGARLTIPDDTITVRTKTRPFAVANEDRAEMPDQFDFSIHASDEPHWYEYNNGEIAERPEKTESDS